MTIEKILDTCKNFMEKVQEQYPDRSVQSAVDLDLTQQVITEDQKNTFPPTADIDAIIDWIRNIQETGEKKLTMMYPSSRHSLEFSWQKPEDIKDGIYIFAASERLNRLFKHKYSSKHQLKIESDDMTKHGIIKKFDNLKNEIKTSTRPDQTTKDKAVKFRNTQLINQYYQEYLHNFI